MAKAKSDSELKQSILFEGGVMPDVENSETEDSVDDLDEHFGFDSKTDEEEDDSLEEEEVGDLEEDETPKKGKNKANSVIALLMEQNKLLMQQSGQNQSKAVALSDVDQRALETGRALINLQGTNPVLYTKVTDFISTELGGGQSKVQVNDKLNSLKTMLKGERFKEIDTTPFEEMISALEISENSSKAEKNQLVQVINALQRDINNLKTNSEESLRSKEEERTQKVLVALKLAEKEFGIPLKRGSEEAEDFVLLVKNGKNPRTAYMKAIGLKETDKKKGGKNSTKEVDLNPKLDKEGVRSQGNRIGKKLFGESPAGGRYGSLFKS